MTCSYLFVTFPDGGKGQGGTSKKFHYVLKTESDYLSVISLKIYLVYKELKTKKI